MHRALVRVRDSVRDNANLNVMESVKTLVWDVNNRAHHVRINAPVHAQFHAVLRAQLIVVRVVPTAVR